MPKRLGLELKITRLMLQVGAMCTRFSRFADAEQILLAVKAYRDDLPHPGSLLALNFVSQGRLHEAQQELEAVLAAYPHHQFGKALLGLVHRERGRPDWEHLLREVVDDGREEGSVKFARELLGLEALPDDTTGSHGRTSDSTPHVQRIYG
jgi:hypothetical protein